MIKATFTGAGVRIRGFGFRKAENVEILQAGIRSMKLRLSKGIGQDDAPTAPLKTAYARRKAKVTGRRAIRDLSFTGALLEEIQPRYADNSLAVADATTQAGRIKARRWSDLLQFSPSDQEAMKKKATELFLDGTKLTVRVGGRLSIFERRTSFSRAA